MSNIPTFECQPDFFFLQAQQPYDQAFLHNWERHSAQLNPVNPPKNPEAKSQYLLARNLQTKLQTMTADGSEASATEIRALKGQIDQIYHRLSPEELSTLNLKFGKRKRKRRYQKRLKAKWREFEAQSLIEREALNAQIDAERAAIRETILRSEQERESQRRTELNEIKKNKADLVRLEQTLNSLQTLRHLRRKRLLPPKPSLTERIESSLATLKHLLTKRKEGYDEKEASLRAQIVQNEAKIPAQRESAVDVEIQTLREALFGPEQHTCAFPEFYLSAEKNLEDLVRIRAEWDQFLVPEGDTHPLASTVPVKWVAPPLNPFESEKS